LLIKRKRTKKREREREKRRATPNKYIYIYKLMRLQKLCSLEVQFTWFFFLLQKVMKMTSSWFLLIDQYKKLSFNQPTWCLNQRLPQKVWLRINKEMIMVAKYYFLSSEEMNGGSKPMTDC
jgi:hypothetical protein